MLFTTNSFPYFTNPEKRPVPSELRMSINRDVAVSTLSLSLSSPQITSFQTNLKLLLLSLLLRMLILLLELLNVIVELLQKLYTSVQNGQ